MLLVITRLVMGADWMFVDGRAAEHAVRGRDVDFARPGRVDQVGGAADRAGRADHVVEHQGDAAFDRSADDVLLLRLQGGRAPFVDNGQLAAQSFGVPDGPLDAAFVRADDDDVVGRQATFAGSVR